MDGATILAIARQELITNVRNRWTLMFAVVFGVLVVSISYAGLMTEGFTGMQSFTRTSASILNLVLYVVPLVALIMGTLSFTGDKGSTELLFSQPVSRTEVMLGKVAGAFASITLSTVLGYSLAGMLIAVQSGPEGLFRYSMFVLLSLGLALCFLSMAVLGAVVSRRKSKAFGLALFLWFFFVLFYDLLTITGALLLRGQNANLFLFLSLFGNPVDMVRVASLILLDNVTIFGAAGAALLRFLGGEPLSLFLLGVGLLAWAVFPLFVSRVLLQRQDI